MEKIILQNVSKNFKIGCKKKKSALGNLLSMFSGRESKRMLKALSNISFTANSGELIGLIGKNGSGKSTLLRTISGVYWPDQGEVILKGKPISLINLKVGLKSRLSMKDNIFLMGSFFGLSQKEIRDKYDSIVELSELGEFTETKMYQFSQGMLERFSFSLAVHSNPDILLLDEIFEVGDESFKEKSAAKIKSLAAEGCTIILVSHDLDLVRKHCDKCVWMDEGAVKMEGSTIDVIDTYRKPIPSTSSQDRRE